MHDFLSRFKVRPEKGAQNRESQVLPESPQDISIEPLNFDTDIEPVAQLYADVFAGPPWNEYTQCGECNKFSGKETHAGDACPHCQTGSLNLAYPLDETIGLVREASKKPDATMYVAKKDNKVIGFTWGYSIPDEEAFFEFKDHYSDEVRAQVKDVLGRNNVTWPLYYFAEIGISEETRGHGVSNLLAVKHVEKAVELHQPLLMTTNWQARMISVAKKFGMQLILGPESYYDKSTDSIVKTGNTASYIDAQNPDRILFLLKQEEPTQSRRLRLFNR